jgi:hypothetical protein
MRKFTGILLALILLAALTLTSCADTSKATPSPSTAAATEAPAPSAPEPSAETTPAPSTEAMPAAPSETPAPSVSAADAGGEAYAQMNVNKILFGGDVDAYFDAYENTDSALDALQPILFSALFAAFDSDKLFIVDDNPADTEFQWTAVYHLINDFEFERDGVTQEAGNILVPADIMAAFYMDEFGVSAVPEVLDSLAGLVTFDKDTGKYTLMSAGIGGLNFVLSNISLSKASSAADPTQSASIRFDVQDNDGKTMKSIVIEIVHAPDSTFKYSVMAAYAAE